MNNKKAAAVIALVLLLLSLMPVSALAEDAVWDGSVAEGFETGSGTKDDPYVIKTASQLAFLSQSVSGGDSFKDKYITLESDIALNKTDDLLWTESAVKWASIGNPVTCFDGFFDGLGHTISGVCTATGSDATGLFGVIGENGSVFNLTVASSSIGGNISVGAIAGINNGKIYYCRNNDAVRGAQNAGGIAGTNNGTVFGCANYGWVGNGGNDGGIAGLNCGTIENCYNVATVDGGYFAAGGIAAENRGTISKCYNAGYIISEYGIAGGIAYENSGNISSCYYLDLGTGTDRFGTKLLQSEMTVKQSFDGFDFEKIWCFNTESDFLYPVFQAVSDGNTSQGNTEITSQTSNGEGQSAEISDASDTLPKPKEKSYALWVLLGVLVILVAIKAAIWFIQKRK